MRRALRWILLSLSLLLAAALVGGGVWLDRWQRATIFSVELGDARWAREAPPDTEVFDLPVGNGETVRAWYVASPNPSAPTVLYLHGSRWNLNSSVFRMERWLDMGVSMLAIDYRGFGESSPRLPSQGSALEDARLAMQELVRRQPDPAKRFVYGHSLGGAIAVDLASEPDTPEFAGLILESTFTSIRDMIATSRWSHIPGLKWLVTQPFDSAAALPQVKAPVLLIHGTSDRVIPHEMSDTLLAAAATRPDGRQELVKIDYASHSGASRHAEYAPAVTGFIDSLSN